LEFSDSALRLLQAYDWPGNVRELENVVERAVVMSSGDIITIDDLPTNIVQLLAEEIELDTSLRSAREKFEEEYLKETLLRFKGNISQSAKYLGLARKNLQEKIKKYRISASKLK
jgi:DNA-binding NtrC family response regulator